MSTGNLPARRGDKEVRRAKALDTLPHDDTVTLGLTQFEFMHRWICAAQASEPVAVEMATQVPPDVFQDEFYRQVFEYLAEKVVKGEAVGDTVTSRHLLHIAKTLNSVDKYAQLQRMMGYLPGDPEELKGYGRTLIVQRRGQIQLELCIGAAQLTENALGNLGDLTVKQVADNLMDRLLNLHSRLSENGGPVTQQEIADHLIARVTRERAVGVDWPYACMQRQLGTMVPGDVIGVSAYSGNGKTMFMANLFLAFIMADVPVIVFPTEMGLRFLERVVAISARVPKKYAEKGDWREATDAQMERYRFAMKDLVGGAWDIVKEGDVSPADVVSRTRLLRKKYKGRTVVVMVDHAHRLKYPNGVKADDALGAGEATRMFKNHATSDTEGGLVYIVFYQPRQPESEAQKYKPVSMYGIRGHSGSTTELDAHLSCFRRLVKCDTTGELKTPWGTPRALWDTVHDLMPTPGDWEERGRGTKVDDEHFYLTSDKDRVNGEQLHTMVMRCHAPSGYIYENDQFANLDLEDE